MNNTEEKIITNTEEMSPKKTESLVDEEKLEADRQKLAVQQERKAEKLRIKKKKARRRALIIILAVIVIVAIIFGVKYVKNKKANTQMTVSVEVKRGESVQYATIQSIVGNEITVLYVDESTVKNSSSGNSKPSNKGDGSSMPSFGGDGSSMPSFGGDGSSMPSFGGDGSSMPSFGGDGSSRPSRGDGSSMPEGFDPSSMPNMGDGQMPEGFDPSSMPSMGDGQMPEGFDPSSMPSNGDGENVDEQKSGNAGQIVELQIPVGTVVYTKLGNTTTFSRLAAGDTIAIIFEENTQNIIRIYMQ